MHVTRSRALAALALATALVGGTLTAAAVPATAAEATGAIHWGIKQSWRSYISGSGTVTMQPPATFDGAGPAAPYAFPATAQTSDDDFVITGTGGVAYYAHGGALDLTLKNTTIVTSGNSGDIVVDYVDVSGPHNRVTIATIGTLTIDTSVTDSVSVTGTGVTLTAAGSTMFADFYPAGTAIDDISATSPIVGAIPTVTIDKSAIDAGGDTITVTGTGFDPAFAVAPSAPVPGLEGHAAGVFVGFGRFAPVWKPSEGASSAARPFDRPNMKWAVLEADRSLVEAAGHVGQSVELTPDGSFTAVIQVTVPYAAMPDSGNFGIYTYAGGLAHNQPSAYAYETYTPVTVNKATAKAKLTLVKKKVKKGKRAKVKVAVTAAGTTPTGKVVVKEGGKKLASLTLANGKAKTKLPKLSMGKHKLRAVYRGSLTVAKAKSTTKKLRVV